MFDIVMPKNNEEEFIAVACELGYSEIVFLSEDINYSFISDRITIKKAFFVSSTSQILRARKRFDYLVANSERRFFESKVDFIINAELFDKRDSFHYKRTTLNQVHAKLCKENNSTIVFSFDNLLNNKRVITLGRMFQNAALTRKYRLRSNAFSMAKEPIHMKSRTILDALLKVLGL